MLTAEQPTAATAAAGARSVRDVSPGGWKNARPVRGRSVLVRSLIIIGDDRIPVRRRKRRFARDNGTARKRREIQNVSGSVGEGGGEGGGGARGEGAR